MPRDIPVGNGKLLVCFDQDYTIRDLYFPHVGQENHVGGNFFRMGVWVDDKFSWVGPEWKRDLRYISKTLVTNVNLYHRDLGIRISCHDAVDFHENIYVREISLENVLPFAREVRLFFTQDFDISGNDVGDTIAYDPISGGLVHYKGSRYFLANGFASDSDTISQYAVGQKGTGGIEGTFRDAEDGFLSGSTIAQGSVDSVIGLTMNLEGGETKKAYYWITVGQDWKQVCRLNDIIRERRPRSFIKRTKDYWSLWVRKETLPFELLPEHVGELYHRSLLVLRTQIDWKGGITAANDSDILLFNRDTYSYVWPRDGALVANALDKAGYPILSQNFYRFAADVIDTEGYFLHKYNPDGTLASSWHPWFDGDKAQLPIQEDETALVIWALWNHFVIYRDIEFIKPLYRPLIKSAADFMCRYRDKETGLPEESYDLWEERRGILSFTVGAVFGGLTAASLFCSIFGEDKLADHYRKVAAEIRDATSRFLWSDKLNRFCRMIYRDSHGSIELDKTCDASLWGLFAFGLYSANDTRIVSTFDALKKKLWVKTDVGGMARQENDYYHRVSKDITGNPWFICTLWYADYLTETSKDEKGLQRSIEILDWVTKHTLASGVLAEQLNPYTGEPLSVSPLTWSHATFVASAQRILRKLQEMHLCPECGLPIVKRKKDWLAQLYSKTCSSIYGTCKVK